jgi:hypothetical protein
LNLKLLWIILKKTVLTWYLHLLTAAKVIFFDSL